MNNAKFKLLPMTPDNLEDDKKLYNQLAAIQSALPEVKSQRRINNQVNLKKQIQFGSETDENENSSSPNLINVSKLNDDTDKTSPMISRPISILTNNNKKSEDDDSEEDVDSESISTPKAVERDEIKGKQDEDRWSAKIRERTNRDT